MPQVDANPTTPMVAPGGARNDEPLAALTAVGPGAPSPLPRDILIGEAGMHFVLSRLLYWGIPAHAAGPGLPYDIIADVGWQLGLVRIQVKSTAVEQRPYYRFVLKRGYHRTRRGTFAYRPGDFDLAAFVTLRLDRVQFRPFPVNRFRATSALFLATWAELESWFTALSALQARRRTPPGGGGVGAPPCLPV